jgi:hypothetical protein
MAVLALVFFLLGHLAQGFMESWESCGDYAIGTSLCCVGLYFAATESSHFEERPDGTQALMRCACHPDGSAKGLLPSASDAKEGGDGNKLPAASCWKVCPPCSEARAYGSALRTAQEQAVSSTACQWRAGNLLLGLFQGICCPGGLVGFGFLVDVPCAGLVCFTLMFSAVSIVGTGLVAMCWSSLAWHGLGGTAPQLWLYRISYAATFLLGLVWLVAAFTGVVDRLDYTENVGGLNS